MTYYMFGMTGVLRDSHSVGFVFSTDLWTIRQIKKSNCTYFSPTRANHSSLSADSFTSPLLPQIKDSLHLLLLQTCASKPPSPTLHSPPPKRATLRAGDTPRAGGTPGWAAPPRLRAARPPTPSPDRLSPAGTYLLYNEQRVLSSPLNN